MAIDTLAMSQIVSDVFDEMLGMVTQPLAEDTEFNMPRMVATIQMSGATEQIVLVEAPLETANQIGATMFDCEIGSLSDEEIQDAVGEIANMIGGNVKGTYEGESLLSLPSVTELVEPSDFQTSHRIAVTVADYPILVRWRDLSPAAV